MRHDSVTGREFRKNSKAERGPGEGGLQTRELEDHMESVLTFLEEHRYVTCAHRLLPAGLGAPMRR
jgi:hypothetical protein